MKTTVHTGKDSRMIVAPTPGGVSVCREVRDVYCEGWATHQAFDLTPDQAGALMFGIEQALEVGEVRAAVTCPRGGCSYPAGNCTAGNLECLGTHL